MLTYPLNKESGRSLYEQLYEGIRRDILSGTLPAHQRLPSKRALAQHLEVSIITVQNAYEQLAAEGYIYSQEKRGYYVSPVERPLQAAARQPAPLPPEPEQKTYFLDLVTNSIDRAYFPFTVWARLMRETLLERDKATLRQVIERELAREGQVFWVHNRVQGLERVVEFVKELAPNARIGMAHGQLPEKKLEETMHAFWHGELDILVCTAIVESGLDFPRANTLIVDQAHLFGLGQLYQLRGRVGRSDRQAFACFVVSDLERLPAATKERLRIILDMDYLGAGFQVAMEDLRLRGAGNILGEVQSGHMGRVGLELYLEMLEQAVNKIKNGGVSLQIETELNLGLTAHIPEDYITDGRERLRWYKRLSAAPDAQARQELELELRDRFGILPQPLEIFMAVLALKQFLSGAQALKADVYEDRLRVLWDEKQNAIAPEKLVPFLRAQKGNAKLIPPSSLELKLDMQLPTPRRLDAARLALGTLLTD